MRVLCPKSGAATPGAHALRWPGGLAAAVGPAVQPWDGCTTKGLKPSHVAKNVEQLEFPGSVGGKSGSFLLSEA